MTPTGGVGPREFPSTTRNEESVALTRRAYDAYARNYGNFADGPERDLFAFRSERDPLRSVTENDRATWKFLAAQVEKLRGDISVIDAGCGQGTWLLRLAARFSTVTGVGVDISSQQIRQANENARSVGPELQKRVKFFIGDATQLEVADCSFDVALCLHDVLNHTPEYGKALDEIHRVVRSGGQVFTSVQATEGPITCYVTDVSQVTNMRWEGDTLSFTDNKGRDYSVYSHLFTADEIRKEVGRYAQVLDSIGVDIFHWRFGGKRIPAELPMLEDLLKRHPGYQDFANHVLVLSTP